MAEPVTGDDTPAVLLVGAPGVPEAAWDGMAAAIGLHCAVIRVVHPGHGGRPPASGATAVIDRCADELDQMLTGAGQERAHVLAWCLGTRLALAFADRHADRVLSLTLLAPALSMRTEDTQPDPVHQTLTTLHRARLAGRTRLRGLVRLMNRPGATAFLTELPEQTLVSYLELYHSWQRYDTTAPLDRLRVPATLIAGEYDDVIPVGWLRRWRSDHMPSARLRVLRGAGHLAFRDQPDEVAALMLDSLPTGKEAR